MALFKKEIANRRNIEMVILILRRHTGESSRVESLAFADIAMLFLIG